MRWLNRFPEWIIRNLPERNEGMAKRKKRANNQRRNELTKGIFTVLESAPKKSFSYKDIAEKLGVTDTQGRNELIKRLGQLKAKDRIRETGKGQYEALNGGSERFQVGKAVSQEGGALKQAILISHSSINVKELIPDNYSRMNMVVNLESSLKKFENSRESNDVILSAIGILESSIR